MENSHKGSEYNNVIETWNQNERNSENANTPRLEKNDAKDTTPTTDLEQLIKEEAKEYDNENKENRVLGGDRATIKDVNNSDDGK